MLRPATDRMVRVPPGHRTLRPDGELVLVTSYWLRRLRDGDVVEDKPKVKAEPKVEDKPKVKPPKAEE